MDKPELSKQQYVPYLSKSSSPIFSFFEAFDQFGIGDRYYLHSTANSVF